MSKQFLLSGLIVSLTMHIRRSIDVGVSFFVIDQIK